jgi:hypothetical protein
MAKIDVVIQSLDDAGTRYQHYQELREIFSEGVEMLKGMQACHKGESESKRQASLQNAVNEIDNRISVLAGYEERMSRWGKIATAIDAIPVKAIVAQQLLTEGVHGTKETNPIQESNYGEGPQDDGPILSDNGECV